MTSWINKIICPIVKLVKSHSIDGQSGSKYGAKKPMKINLVTITIWQGKAYIPSNGKYKSGIITNIEPIQVVDPVLNELLLAVDKVLKTDPILLPEPSREEAKYRIDLLPKITGARSWKRLCRMGIDYMIEQSDKGYILVMSQLDSKGRWEFDSKKQKTFPPGTPLSVVIQAVLDDLNTRLPLPMEEPLTQSPQRQRKV